jgi:hypothetical protein
MITRNRIILGVVVLILVFLAFYSLYNGVPGGELGDAEVGR